ncbi:MAG: hypothetical protein A3J59_03810 [Candidatus Buchananbacteria bacterium RIFCSPHIGHO2_02_FULL_56_16]|uniref:Uncharacterized protein n=1 Tax=Candidatus Buchananbacteria bacterium RIFCSPHIGHO2_02_FULL_56_16 TaxID=1797542 RepID=A0A1G1YKN8_9BACT|nr:MAG: hypothetical protein A3J59_03810 [Candidatus Buchananbacteria bacterium RIFCSPHIGHO2_02_FULL_56_16]
MIQLQHLQEIVLVNVGRSTDTSNYLEYYVSGITSHGPRQANGERGCSFSLLYPGSIWDWQNLLPAAYFSDDYRWLVTVSNEIICTMVARYWPIPEQFATADHVSVYPKDFRVPEGTIRSFSEITFQIEDCTRPAFFAGRFRTPMGIWGRKTKQRIITLQEPRLRPDVIRSWIEIMDLSVKLDARAAFEDASNRCPQCPWLGKQIGRYTLAVIPNPLFECVVQPLLVPPEFLPVQGQEFRSIPWPDFEPDINLPEALVYVYEVDYWQPREKNLQPPPLHVTLTINTTEEMLFESSGRSADHSYKVLIGD